MFVCWVHVQKFTSDALRNRGGFYRRVELLHKASVCVRHVPMWCPCWPRRLSCHRYRAIGWSCVWFQIPNFTIWVTRTKFNILVLYLLNRINVLLFDSLEQMLIDSGESNSSVTIFLFIWFTLQNHAICSSESNSKNHSPKPISVLVFTTNQTESVLLLFDSRVLIGSGESILVVQQKQMNTSLLALLNWMNAIWFIWFTRNKVTHRCSIYQILVISLLFDSLQ